MAPPPLLTWVVTRSGPGRNWSRSGPTLPDALAAARVWQPEQLAVNSDAPSAAEAGAGVAESPSSEPPQPATNARRTAARAKRGFTGATVPGVALALH